ncbi:hypothetical protein JAAARDRAFT_51339 [Jaapia argillacea MUCL 33604]|uniref:CCHC-type domain-containing protein n=1 Tax=Jaapia argillacea MUCL 33604 TaxID=933084 RepID=A0A067P5W9_9AGAM|nr:hypothetical protein JAAARDRAFT_51339 [Jaapia argillacea MUCL 33604]
MSTSQSSDTLPSTIPKLDENGMNWVIFSERFMDMVQVKGFWGYYDGSVTILTFATTPLTAAQEVEVTAWKKAEATAKYLLTQKLHSHTLIKFTSKGEYALTNARTQFLDSKCGKDADVQAFLDKLVAERSCLSGMGVNISEEDMCSTVIKCLPDYLSDFTAAQLAATRTIVQQQYQILLAMSPSTPVPAPGKIDPNFLINLISKEFDRVKAKQASRSKAKADNNEALSVQPWKGKWKGKGDGLSGDKSKPKGACRECGEKGHFKDSCPKKSLKVKPKDDAKAKSGMANIVEEPNSDDNGAWAMDYDSDSDIEEDSQSDDSMPSIQSVSDSDSESEAGDVDDDDEVLFLEVGDDSLDVGSDWSLEMGFGSEASLLYTKVDSDIDGGLDAVDTAAALGDTTWDKMRNIPQKELYDSRSTCHISPYCDNFENFVEIPPKPFTAAKKQNFNAVGLGKLVLEVPNGVSASQLQLTKVLYSPEVGYTLVLIGQLDQLGFSTTFADGRCTIKGPNGKSVGEIPRSVKGLYHVIHNSVDPSTGSANAAEEQLVKKGFVTGVALDKSSAESVFCEPCVKAKATRKSVPKERQGSGAERFGDEIHTDV